jgi:hypothetical protein
MMNSGILLFRFVLDAPDRETFQGAALWDRSYNRPAPDPDSASLNAQLVDVTPLPVLARLKRLDDRMSCPVKVFRGVLVLRRVAAPDVPAMQTAAQVHPRIPHL